MFIVVSMDGVDLHRVVCNLYLQGKLLLVNVREDFEVLINDVKEFSVVVRLHHVREVYLCN